MNTGLKTVLLSFLLLDASASHAGTFLQVDRQARMSPRDVAVRECIQALKSDDRLGGRGLVLGNTVRSLHQEGTGRSFLFSAHVWEAGARVPVSLTCSTSGSGRTVTAIGKTDASTVVDVAQR